MSPEWYLGDDQKSAVIEFKNPREVDESNLSERHAQEYWDAMDYIRGRIGPDINHLVGKWLVAVQSIDEDDDPEEMVDVLDTLLDNELDKSVSIELSEEGGD